MEANKLKIAVAGTGYVGLSLACLLARFHSVTAVDVIPTKVDLVNSGKSPIRDVEIESFLASGTLDLRATLDAKSAYAEADLILVAAPTNYDPVRNFFDTSAVESVLALVKEVNPQATVVVKSTVPVGFTVGVRERIGLKNLLFSPEFLRESCALYDNLHPSRIIVGCDMENAEQRKRAEQFVELLASAAEDENVPTLVMGATEAEAVKLFANTYLALRVSYFNELDTYAEVKGLDSRRIIEGVSLDPRIGNFYNNPSIDWLESVNGESFRVAA